MVTSLWHGDQQLRIPRGFWQVSSATVKGMHSVECSSDSVLCFMLPVPEQHDGNCLYWLNCQNLIYSYFACFASACLLLLYIYAILHIVCPSVVCVDMIFSGMCGEVLNNLSTLISVSVSKNRCQKSYEEIMRKNHAIAHAI